jgi:hypothetical protein
MRKYLLILIPILIISCSSDVKLLKIRNDFIYNNFSTQHFYITPVINNTNIPSFDKADIRLEKVFKEEKKNLIIYGADYTLSKIAGSKEPELLINTINSYNRDKEFDKDKILSMSNYLGNGYIIFSSINDFNTNQREYSQQIVINKGKDFDTAIERTKEIKSTIYGSFFIFDLKTGELCFYVEHESSKIKSSSHTEQGCFDGCLFSLVDAFFPTPAPMGANDMAEYLFKDIVEAIPNKSDKIDKILKKDNRFELK